MLHGLSYQNKSNEQSTGLSSPLSSKTSPDGDISMSSIKAIQSTVAFQTTNFTLHEYSASI